MRKAPPLTEEQKARALEIYRKGGTTLYHVAKEVGGARYLVRQAVVEAGLLWTPKGKRQVRKNPLYNLPVVCLNDPETGGERRFKTLAEAQAHYDVGNVIKVCRGLSRHDRGLLFRWGDDRGPVSHKVFQRGVRHMRGTVVPMDEDWGKRR